MSNLYKDNHPISSTKNAPTVNTKIEASPYQKKKKNRGFAQETELFFILFYFIFIKKKRKKKKKKKRSSHSKIASHIHKEK